MEYYAYWKHRLLSDLLFSASVTNNVNNIGLSIDPCGTPKLKYSCQDFLSSNWNSQSVQKMFWKIQDVKHIG